MELHYTETIGKNIEISDEAFDSRDTAEYWKRRETERLGQTCSVYICTDGYHIITSPALALQSSTWQDCGRGIAVIRPEQQKPCTYCGGVKRRLPRHEFPRMTEEGFPWLECWCCSSCGDTDKVIDYPPRMEWE